MSGNRNIVYGYDKPGLMWSNDYLWPQVEKIIQKHSLSDKRAFDLGCGNGAIADKLSQLGFQVTGVDPSETGIAIARANYPSCRFEVGATQDDLVSKYGRFPVVVSLEVLPVCFHPKDFAERVFDLVTPGGIAVVSTPYHGYLKNLAIAALGKFDDHFSSLWEQGLVRFFSVNTLTQLLMNAGFADVDVVRVGRIPPLAKTMIAVARKAR